MKYLHLVAAGLLRHKGRSFLTVMTIAAAFLLFGLLDAVRASFEQVEHSADGTLRLHTSARLSYMQTLPRSLQSRIEGLPGVQAVTFANWFGGAYRDARNPVFSLAVAPNYLDLYPELQVGEAQRRAFATIRSGALVGRRLADRFGWQVGDKVHLLSTIFPDRTGSKVWAFEIVGIFGADSERGGDWFARLFLLRWDYFDDTTPWNNGQVGWYVSRVADARQADRVARAIDALTANSDHSTRTLTEQAATASWLRQFADVSMISGSIIGAVFFTLLLVTAHVAMQSLRERTRELAVMKAIGFANRSLMAIMLAESLLLLFAGGTLGLASAHVVAPIISDAVAGLLTVPAPGATTWWLGLALMLAAGLLVGAVPATRALRLRIVDALASP